MFTGASQEARPSRKPDSPICNEVLPFGFLSVEEMLCVSDPLLIRGGQRDVLLAEGQQKEEPLSLKPEDCVDLFVQHCSSELVM